MLGYIYIFFSRVTLDFFFFGGTEKSHEKHQSEWSESRSTFENWYLCNVISIGYWRTSVCNVTNGTFIAQ